MDFCHYSTCDGFVILLKYDDHVKDMSIEPAFNPKVDLIQEQKYDESDRFGFIYMKCEKTHMGKECDICFNVIPFVESRNHYLLGETTVCSHGLHVFFGGYDSTKSHESCTRRINQVQVSILDMINITIEKYSENLSTIKKCAFLNVFKGYNVVSLQSLIYTIGK